MVGKSKIDESHNLERQYQGEIFFSIGRGSRVVLDGEGKA